MASLNTDEKQLLSNLLNPVQSKLRLAWLTSIVNTLLLVGQMWLLATVFSHLLNVQFSQGSDVAGEAVSSSLSISSLEVSSLEMLQNNWHWWLAGLAMCFAVRPLLMLMRDKLGFHASVQVRQTLRARLLDAMAQLGTARYRFGSDGSLSSQLIEQTEALDGYVSRFAIQKMVTVSTPLIILLAVAWQSWVAAGILLLTAPLVPVFMILIGHLTARKSAEQFLALSQLSGRFLDWVRGMTTLKRLQATDIAHKELSLSSEDYRRRTMDVLKIAFLNGAALEFLAALCIALTAVYLGFGLMGILPWQKNEVPVPYFGALFILLLAPEFYAPLRQLGADYHAKAQAEGAVQSLLPILQASDIDTNEFIDSPAPMPSHNQQERVDKLSANKSSNFLSEPSISPSSNPFANPFTKPFAIHADQFGMTGLAQRVRLAPISFHVPAGHRIAITGDSGSGKSSLLQALMGFAVHADDVSGSLSLILQTHARQTGQEDVSVTALAELGLLTAYRDQIGYLSQQVALMPMSISDNLRLAKSHASDEELWDVLEAVQLAELLRQLPKGLDTPLGERGRGLSGGQQQRLGIAQLLLQDAQLWLLDEPTEHLDPDTAEAIHRVLQQVSVGKTVLWVTHHHNQLPWLDALIHISAPAQQNHASNTNNHDSNQINDNSVNDNPLNDNPLNDNPVNDVAHQMAIGGTV